MELSSLTANQKMNELNAMNSINRDFAELDADEIRRVINWVNDKYGYAASINGAGEPKELVVKRRSEEAAKSHRQFALLGGLHLEGNLAYGASAEQVAKDKIAKTKKHQCAVAVWYYANHSDVEEVSVDHVYTYFDHVGWAMPKDLLNTLHQAGSDGLLDVSDQTNIRLTDAGIELVEFQLVSESGERITRAPMPEWMRAQVEAQRAAANANPHSQS